jgi:uncharacterized membrane protein YkoI
MKRTTRIAIAAVAAVAGLATAGVAAVSASTSDDNEIDTPITGTDLQKASDAALASTGQGRVTGTEVGDEESYYEIEVTLDNGTEVDVQLDKDFKVVGSEADTADSNQDEAD